jgi:PAS domain S-box-containing protein
MVSNEHHGSARWSDADRRLRWASMAPLGLLLIFVSTAWIVVDRLSKVIAWDRHSVEVLGNGSELQKLFIDFETGMRGFELTKQEQFLEPTEKAATVVGAQFDNLKALVADNPQQAEALELIRRDFDNWRSFSAKVIQIVRSGGVIDGNFNSYGKSLMDQVRSDADKFTAEEHRLLVARDQQVGIHERNDLIILGVFLAFVSLGIVLIIRTQMRRQSVIYQATLAAEAAEAGRFKVTLSSIGDAVVVTDRNGNITFLNREAERMTGWTMNEALGNPLRIVFRIVNELSREAVDDPVEKVFRERRVVGLANHTVLISRTGVDWTIEDSASPILDSNNEIIGVVLVFQDATEKRRAQRELILARDQAIASSQAKDEFLATLSHELRTPLNPVLLIAAENAQRTDLDSDVRRDFETIANNVTLEAHLIDDLLDLARVSNHKLVLKSETGDIRKVITEALGKVRADIKSKRLTVDVSMREPMWVLADTARAEQIFWNVLKNAVKFTPAEGCLSINAVRAENGKSAIINVTDTGIGMSAEDISRVFEPFAQGRHSFDSTAAHSGGLGLGLTIARNLVEIHGGTISAASEGRGKGTRIEIIFPLVELTGDPSAPIPVLVDDRSVKAVSYRILLVEDHLSTAEVLRHLLTRRGNDVVLANSVSAALAEAEARHFDFVISDLGLPDGDGLDLMKKLHEKHGLMGIATSGFGTEADIERSKQAGFAVHLTKPIMMAKLEEEINGRRWTSQHPTGGGGKPAPTVG